MYNAFYYRTVGNVTAPIEEDDDCDHGAEKEGDDSSSLDTVDALSVGSSASRPSTPSTDSSKWYGWQYNQLCKIIKIM